MLMITTSGSRCLAYRLFILPYRIERKVSICGTYTGLREQNPGIQVRASGLILRKISYSDL